MTAYIGIDLGTTNTVVALADRGNYPILPLGEDDAQLHTPTLLAMQHGEVRTGWEALAVWEDPDWQLLGSPKRFLGTPAPEALLQTHESLDALLRLYFVNLKKQLKLCPHLEGEEHFEAVIGVPANANSLQRYRTIRAAEAAGFVVKTLLHEPTAAAIEYAHRHPHFGRGKAERHVLVYDLGGGTFDASLVRIEAEGFTVLRSAGLSSLGGDDFDRVMAELALEKSGTSLAALEPSLAYRLLRRCRDAKEKLQGTTRKWLLDLEELGLGEVSLYREEYFEKCLPLVQRSIALLDEVLAPSLLSLEDIDALLLVGGGSQMPLVKRELKERMGARLKISPHPFASTAIGLAIYADHSNNLQLSERFSRHFGVWREADSGQRPAFDPIFVQETPLPPEGEKLRVVRQYRPTHNVGYFQFEECRIIDKKGLPEGDRTAWCAIRFPFDPALPINAPLESISVERHSSEADFYVEERYECDSRGMITVTLTRSLPIHSQSYLLHGPEQVRLRAGQ